MISRVLKLRFLLIPLMSAALLVIVSHGAAAATPALPGTASTESAATDLPTELTPAQVDDLVARLSDEEVRALLIRQLDKVAEPEPVKPKGSALDRLADALIAAEVRMIHTAAATSLLPQLPAEVWKRTTEGSDVSTWWVIFMLIIFFAVGAGVEWLFRRFAINVNRQDEPSEPLPFKARLRLVFIRGIIDVVSIIIFAVATLIVWLTLKLPTDHADLLFTSLLSGVVIFRLVTAVFRFILSPRTPWLRLVKLEDDVAISAYNKLRLVVAMLEFLIWLPKEILLALEFREGEIGIVAVLASALLVITLIALIWQMRPDTKVEDTSLQTQDYLTRNWHLLAIGGVLFSYFLALGVYFSTGAPVLEEFEATLVVLGLVPIVDKGLRSWVSGFVSRREHDDATTAEVVAEPDDQADAQDHAYDAAITNNVRILLSVLVVIVLAEIWDLPLYGLLEGLVGERFASILVNISVTGLLAYAVWSIVSAAVTRIAGPEAEPGVHAGDGDGGGGGGSRLGTVLPLFKKFLFITLLVMMVLIVLSSMGVNIGPLIAGAGIVGIAIGFGAQTLVKDIVSGLFFLLDDAFRVGEYVTIGSTKGTVEKISVRSLRLRHHNGPLHTVPFGEIQTLTNWSRDWAIMKFEIRVPFETDVDMVRRMIKKVGQAMIQDEELGPFFLEPLKSQGVNRMDDSSFIIRCKFTAIPGNQFYLRREAYMRIQRAFEEKGIKFAPRRVIVETTGPNVPNDPKLAAAAAGALDPPDPKQAQGKDEPG